MSQVGSSGRGVPYVLLAASLAMILAIVGYLLWVSHGRDRLRFQNRVQKTVDEIERRVETRIAVVRATRGLFTASEHLTREEFRDFVATLNLPQRYPGMAGLGFARAEGPDRVVLAYHEGAGSKPPVLDAVAEIALRRARDDGFTAASSQVDAGFLMFGPVYKRGVPIATVEQRRAAVTGYVVALMSMDQLLKGTLDPEDEEEIELTVNTTNAGPPEDGGWFDSRTLTVAGQPWRIEFRTRPAFMSRSSGGPILFLLFAGLAFCAALFAVSRAQVRARSAAENLASRLTRSAEALSRSEDRGRRIIESALDAVVGIDLDGRITAWNPKAVEMFGWTESDAIGRILSETIIPSEYKDAHLRGLATFRATGHGPALNRRIEVSALRRDGSEFPAELSITPIGTGAQTTFTGFVRDLTDRRKAEASLRESIERFRIAAGTTTDFIYEWDPATGRVQWFGESAQDLPATRTAWEEIVHPEDKDRFRTANPAGVGVHFAEYRIRRKDGAWRTWTDRAEAVVDREGRPVRWIGSIDDVSDRRTLERERERLLDRLQMQMERMPVACILTGPDFQVRLWNPAAARIFGYSREEATGRPFEELLLPPEARAEASRHLRTLAEGRHSSITTWENVTRGGGRILCEWHAGPLFEADGAFAGLQAMAIDTTERARLEGQLRQAQKMEAVGRLAGGIAHDFNNLLTTVSGYGEILHDQLKPDDPARSHVGEIRDAARRAADLTRQLLAFSRKQVLEPSVMDLNAVLADMDKMLRRVIGEDVVLVTALDPALGRVKADRGQVEQVIMNLAVNARDAMPKGGKLTLETRNIEIDASYVASHPDASTGPHVMLAVSDTGGGIPAAVLPRIFEPFFTTKERGKGTGLGLATVYGIVKQSGGHVSAYSEPGRGAAFKVYLRRVDGKVDTRVRPAPSATPVVGTETILVVEDEAPVRKLLSQILRRSGYTLIEAATGIDALKAVADHQGPIHLMVTDVVMPGMSGRDLAKKMETLRPGMKVLYSSGYTENAIVHHGELEPGTAFLPKPFTPTALAQKVREVLG